MTSDGSKIDYNAMLRVLLPDARRRGDEAAVARICDMVSNAVTEQPSFRTVALWHIDDKAAVARICATAGRVTAERGSFTAAAHLYIRAVRAAREAGDRVAMVQAASTLAALAPGVEHEPSTPDQRGLLARWHEAKKAYGYAAGAFEQLGRDDAARRARTHEQWCDQQIRRQLGGRPLTKAEELELERPNLVMCAPALPDYMELAVGGFAAVKLLGPFLEAFAAKLGEQLGESAGRALGRIRLCRKKGQPRHLSVKLPGSPVETLLVLPEDFTDEAKLALIDLDIDTDEVRGHMLSWDPATSTWQIHGQPAFGRHRYDTDTDTDTAG